MNKFLTGLIVATTVVFAQLTFATDFPEVDTTQTVIVAETTILNFPFDESVVVDEQKQAFLDALHKVGQQLGNNPGWTLRIEGHTDETGTESYNMGLGQRRIDEMKSALIAGGASAAQVQTVSYGEVNPLKDGHSDDAWATNRRIVVKLIETN